MKKLALILAVSSFCLLGNTDGCKQSTVKGPNGKEMTLHTPEKLTIRRGTTETLEVGVERKNFTDDINFTISGLPRGVSAQQGTINTAADRAAFVIEAKADSDLVTDHVAQVRVEGPDGMATTQEVKITVKE